MTLNFRSAVESDIENLVGLLADDDLGTTREDFSAPLNPRYTNAFRNIERDPNNELVVIESGGELADNELVGTLHLTFIPYLTHIGSWRCLIEGVRIARKFRGQGLGHECIRWAIQRAAERKCTIVQLTSDKRRADAIRFYESLGFQATHEGLKLKL